MRTRKPKLHDPSTYDILAAAWVFACNDENSIVTYEGIKHRLQLASTSDVRSLITSRGELFRQGVPERRLKEWKDAMRQGKRLPAWIREIEEADLRTKTIDQISWEDVFRSQFRAADKAPQAKLETLDWGLNHIERLRKAEMESHAKTATSWQVWLVFAVSILGVIATIVAAVIQRGARPQPAPCPEPRQSAAQER